MKHLLALLAFASFACGDPLIGSRFAGTPDVSLGGAVRLADLRVPGDHGELALRVFWIGAPSGGGAPVEQEARLDSGFAEYSMTLFDAPPPGASAFSSLLDGAPLALGVIALYADRNGNGALELDEDLLLGATAQHLLVFAGATITEGDPAAALLGAIPAGYHVFEHDRESACHFVDAASCAPEGGLARVSALDKVALSIWSEPEKVIVPAPAIASGGASVWAVP